MRADALRVFQRAFGWRARAGATRQLARRAQPGAADAIGLRARDAAAQRQAHPGDPQHEAGGERPAEVLPRRRVDAEFCAADRAAREVEFDHAFLPPLVGAVPQLCRAVEPDAVVQERCWSPAVSPASRSKMPRCSRSGADHGGGIDARPARASEPDFGPGVRIRLPHDRDSRRRDSIRRRGNRVTMRAGTPAARIIIAYAEAKWPQNPRLLSNSVVSTESMRGDAGLERVFEAVVAEPVEHGARELGVAAGARAHLAAPAPARADCDPAAARSRSRRPQVDSGLSVRVARCETAS